MTAKGEAVSLGQRQDLNPGHPDSEASSLYSRCYDAILPRKNANDPIYDISTFIVVFNKVKADLHMFFSRNTRSCNYWDFGQVSFLNMQEICL